MSFDVSDKFDGIPLIHLRLLHLLNSGDQKTFYGSISQM